MAKKPFDFERFQWLSWQGFVARLHRERAEASVALSHEPDCECSVCERVKARLEGERSNVQ